MASSLGIELPPGFERMSRKEQVDYAQRLWDHVAPQPEELPAPQWQIDLARERLEEHLAHPEDVISHEEVMRRARQRLEQRRQDRVRSSGGS